VIRRPGGRAEQPVLCLEIHHLGDMTSAPDQADIACRTLAELSPSVTNCRCPVWQVRCPAGRSWLLQRGPSFAPLSATTTSSAISPS